MDTTPEHSDVTTQVPDAATPSMLPAGHPGRTQGIIAIVCAVISLLILPPVFGIVGIVLGSISMKKGQKTLGLVAIILSVVFMVVGMAYGFYVGMHPQG